MATLLDMVDIKRMKVLKFAHQHVVEAACVEHTMMLKLKIFEMILVTKPKVRAAAQRVAGFYFTSYENRF